MKPRTMIWGAFLAGLGTAFGIICLIQDWLGLEAYLHYVQNNWVNIHWAVWVPVISWNLYILYFIIKKVPE